MIDSGELASTPHDEQDLAAIESILSKPGVRETVQRFGNQFNSQPGKSNIYGVTATGLVVGVREDEQAEPFKPGYFKGWALDATLPADQIEQQVAQADFSYTDVEDVSYYSPNISSIFKYIRYK